MCVHGYPIIAGNDAGGGGGGATAKGAQYNINRSNGSADFEASDLALIGTTGTNVSRIEFQSKTGVTAPNINFQNTATRDLLILTNGRSEIDLSYTKSNSSDEITGFLGGSSFAWLNVKGLKVDITCPEDINSGLHIDGSNTSIKAGGANPGYFAVAPSLGNAFMNTRLQHEPAVNGNESALLSQVQAEANGTVKISASDTTKDYLGNKVSAGTNITFSTLNVGGNENLQISSTGGAPSANPLMFGANAFNCTSVSGYSQKMTALKVTALGSGKVNKLSCYVYNVYGAVRKLELGVYDYAGSKLSSASVTLAVQQNKTVTISIPEITVVSGTQYWLAVYADGIDIPGCTSFSAYSATFPSGMHIIQNDSAGSGLPATISATYPFGVSTFAVPLTAFA